MLRACFAFVLACAVVAGPVVAAEQQVTDRVFLVRDKPGTATHFQMITLAGCADEADGQCRGIAHYLEHLVLVGRNPENAEIAVRFFPDARSNGWTSMRSTIYAHSMPARDKGPAEDLEKLFQFYAARLREFAISEEDAVRERNVVLQEHDLRVASSPLRIFQRRLDRELIPDHPSGQWVIGTREGIERFTVEDARAFHRSWYGINNVYFVVRGDIDAPALKAVAERALGGLQPKVLPPRTLLRNPEFAPGRNDLRETHAQVKRATVSYKKLVRMPRDDTSTMRAARSVLGAYLTSRLPGSPHAVLVETGNLATDGVLVSLQSVAQESYVFSVTAEVAPDASPEMLLEAIAAYVDGLGKAAIAPETVERLKRRQVDGWADGGKDLGRAYSRLASWLANRSTYRSYVEWPAQLAAVSADQIARITAAVSGPGKLVTGIMAPKAEEASK